ncbi:MAG TPA: sensor histidine kinase [Terriglobales bacterium]|nr:sensor histidine kinase [Terriglobales bacterium]
MRLLPKDKEIGWIPFVWLIYVLEVPLVAFLSKAGAREWTLDLLGMGVLIVLYFRGYWAKGAELLWIIAGIALLGVLFAPSNAGACVYFVYAAAFAGEAGSPKRAVWIIAALLAIIAAETWLLRLPAYFWAPAVIFTVLIGAVDTHYAERRRQNRKLLLAHEEVEHMAKVAERERIARDLHDVLGHTLSVIILKSELASKLADVDPVRASAEIKEVERISREALAQVRSTVRGYQAQSLEAEASHAVEVLRAAGVQVNCEITRTSIPATHEGVLALALREAVTNVIRHAGATVCELVLHQNNGSCRLEIKDNGCGATGAEGVGLSGMRMRVEALGGSLKREVDTGTRLLITLPLEKP